MSNFVYVYYVLEEEPTDETIRRMLDFLDGGSSDELQESSAVVSGDSDAVYRSDSMEYQISIDDPDISIFDDNYIIECSIYEGNFAPQNVGADDAIVNRDRLVNFIHSLYNQLIDDGTDIRYVCGLSPTEAQTLIDGSVSIPETQINGETIQKLFWLQILPQEMISQIGKERFLTAPAWKSTELPDNAISLILYSTPIPFREPDADTAPLDDVTDYLGLSN